MASGRPPPGLVLLAHPPPARADESAAQTAGTPDTGRWRVRFGASTTASAAVRAVPAAAVRSPFLPRSGGEGPGEGASPTARHPPKREVDAVLPSPCVCLHGEGPGQGPPSPALHGAFHSTPGQASNSLPTHSRTDPVPFYPSRASAALPRPASADTRAKSSGVSTSTSPSANGTRCADDACRRITSRAPAAPSIDRSSPKSARLNTAGTPAAPPYAEAPVADVSTGRRRRG